MSPSVEMLTEYSLRCRHCVVLEKRLYVKQPTTNLCTQNGVSF